MKKIKEHVEALLGMELRSFWRIWLITLFIGFARGLRFNYYIRFKISVFISNLFNCSFTPKDVETWLYIIIFVIFAIVILFSTNFHMFLWDICAKKKNKNDVSNITIFPQHRFKKRNHKNS